MLLKTRDDLDSVLSQVGLNEEPKMLGMHLSEIEAEADNILDLLIVVRSYARAGDGETGQETLAELTIALEHLLHHAKEAVPMLQKQLDIGPDEIEEQ